MKTKTINLYSYNELSESAKRAARNHFEDDCAKWYSNINWKNALKTFKRVSELSLCTFTINKSDEEEYFCSAIDQTMIYNHFDKDSDKMRFEKLRNNILEMNPESQADKDLQLIAKDYVYNEGKYGYNFLSNLSSIMSKFANKIKSYDQEFMTRKELEDYIDTIKTDFLESGKVFEE